MTGATFDRGRFETMLDEIGAMLGDLWAVDEALRLTEPPKGEPYGIGSQVDIGRRYPFQRNIHIETGSNPISPQAGEQAQELVDALAATGRSWGEGISADLRGALHHVIRPIPSTFEEAVSVVRSGITDNLETLVNDDFGLLASHLGDWEGSSADQFADYFYNQVEGAVGNQVYAAASICAGLAGSKAIVHLGQHSVMGLIESAHTVLDDQLKQRQIAHRSEGSSVADWVMLATTFMALATAIPTAGASVGALEVGVAVISGTGTLLRFAVAQVEDGERRTFEAESAEDVSAGLFAGCREIQDRLRSHWGALEAKLEELHQQVLRVDALHLLSPRRPRLVTGVTPDSFHHESAAR